MLMIMRTVTAEGAFLREQEKVDEPPLMSNRMAVNVAKANALLTHGSAREALALYKDTIRTAEEEAAELQDVIDDMSEDKEWSVEALIHGDFSPDEQEDITQTLLARAELWRESGEFDRSVDTYEKVFILDPLSVDASEGIDRVRRELIRARRREEKQIEAMDADEDRKIVSGELNRAVNFIKTGDPARAKIHLSRALFVDPDNREAKRLLAEVHGRQ